MGSIRIEPMSLVVSIFMFTIILLSPVSYHLTNFPGSSVPCIAPKNGQCLSDIRSFPYWAGMWTFATRLWIAKFCITESNCAYPNAWLLKCTLVALTPFPLQKRVDLNHICRTRIVIRMGRTGLEPAEPEGTRFTVWPATNYGISSPNGPAPVSNIFIVHMLYTIRFAAFHRKLFYPATSQNWTDNFFSPAGFSPCLIGSHAKLPLVF